MCYRPFFTRLRICLSWSSVRDWTSVRRGWTIAWWGLIVNDDTVLPQYPTSILKAHLQMQQMYKSSLMSLDGKGVNGVWLFCRFRVAAAGVWLVQAVRQHADLAPHVERGEEGGFHIYDREGREWERLYLSSLVWLSGAVFASFFSNPVFPAAIFCKLFKAVLKTLFWHFFMMEKLFYALHDR